MQNRRSTNLPENAPSRRVLEKLGFIYERTFVAHDEESVLYRRRRDDLPLSTNFD